MVEEHNRRLNSRAKLNAQWEKDHDQHDGDGDGGLGPVPVSNVTR